MVRRMANKPFGKEFSQEEAERTGKVAQKV